MEDYEPRSETDSVSELPICHSMEVMKEVSQVQEQTRPILPQTKPPVPDYVAIKLRLSKRTPKLR